MSDFGVIVGLDVANSAEEIKNDIKNKLKPALDSDASARLKLIAQIDLEKTYNTIKAQLGDITKSLSDAKINLGIDSATMQSSIKTTVAKAAESANKTAVIKPTVNVDSLDGAFKLIIQKYKEVASTDVAPESFKALENQLQRLAEKTKGVKIAPENLSQFVDAISRIQSIQNIPNIVNIFEKVTKKTLSATEAAKKYEQVLKSTFEARISSKGLSTEALDLIKTFNVSPDKSGFFTLTYEQLLKVSKIAPQVQQQIEQIQSRFKDGILPNSITTPLTNLGNTVNTVSNSVNTLETDVKQSAETETKKINDVTAAYNEQNKVVARNNELKKTTNLNADGNITGSATVTGTVGNTVTTYRDGADKITGYTVTENYQAMAKALAQAETNAVKLTSKLQEVKTKYEDINVSKPIKDSGHIAQLTAQYEKAVSAIGKVKTADADSMSVMKANAESEIAALERLVAQYRNAEYAATQLRTKDISTVKSVETSNIDKLVNTLTKAGVPMGNLNAEITRLKQTLTSVTDKDGLTNYLNQFDVLKSKAENIKAIYVEISKAITDLGKASNNTQFKQNSSNSNVLAIKGQIDSLQSAYRRLLSDLTNAGTPESITKISAELNGLKSRFVSVTASAKNLQSALKDSKAAENLSTKIAVLTNKLIAFKNANSKAMNSTKLSSNGLTFSAEVDNMLAKLKQCTDPALYNQIANNFRKIDSEITAMGLKGSGFFGSLWANMKKFASWMGMTTVMSGAAMQVRNLFNTIIDLDTALIDLKKTFKGTDSELNQFYYDANKVAKQLGVTTKEVIEQSSAWSRLGFSTAEASANMAKYTAIFKNISPGMDADTATDGLISMMKAFKIGLENTSEVLDGIISKVNEVGNTAALNNQDIVEAMTRSSAAMAAANNTIEETIALNTASIEITRNAETTANAWKTVSMRLRSYDENTEEFSEDLKNITGEIADLTKTASNGGKGISLFTDESRQTYKSTYEIIKEIAKIWDELSDKNQAELLEKLAGKRNAQVVAAAIKNFDAAEKAMQTMANSAGSAEREMNTYMESLAYSTNAFKESWTEIGQTAIDRGDIKTLVNMGTSALNVINEIIKKLGVVPTLITAIVGVMSAKGSSLINFLSFDKGTKQIQMFGRSLNDLKNSADKSSSGFRGIWKNISNIFNGTKNDIKALNDFNNALKNGETRIQAYNKYMSGTSNYAKDLAKNVAKGEMSIDDANKQMNEISLSSKMASIGVNMLNTAFNMLVSMGVAAAINIIIQGITKLANAYKENIKKIQEYTDNIKTLEGDISSLSNEFSEVRGKIEELRNIESPTLFEQDELNRLIEYNQELERQIQFKKYQLEIEKQSADQSAREAWNNTQWNWGAFDKNNEWYEHLLNIATAGTYSVGSSTISNLGNLFQGNFMFQQERLLTEYENTLDNLDTIKGWEDKYTPQGFNEVLQKYETKIDKHEKDLLKRRNEWELQLLGLDPNNPENSEIIKQLEENINTFDRLYAKSQGTVSKSFTEVFNDVKFADVTTELKNLAKEGKLTVETFNNTKGIDSFKTALEAVGYTSEDVDEIIRSIIAGVNNSSSAMNNGANAVEGYAASFDELADSIKNVLDLQDNLKTVFEKVTNGVILSASEIIEILKTFPELYNKVQVVDGGFTFDTNDLKAEYNKQNALMIAQLKGENIANQSIIDEYNTKKIELFDPSKNQPTDRFAYGKTNPDLFQLSQSAKTAQTEIERNNILIEILSQGIDEHTIKMNAMSASYDDVKKNVNEYNKNIQTIDKAIQSMNEGQALSYDEMVALVEISPALQSSIQERSDGYYIEVEALNNLKIASRDERNSYIEDRKAEVESQIKATKAIITELSRINSAYDYMQNKDRLNNAFEELKFLEDTLAVYESLFGTLYNNEGKPGGSDSTTDKLQNEIDYYNTIIDAIEAVTDKKIEAIDKEIEGLEKQKDALSDSNDERQRELDLIEARNNLDKAKKKTVFVFDKDKGFVEVADQKAIDEAQQKYDEQLNKIETAKIDKQIEELNQVKDSYTKYKETFTNMSSEIGNAIVIEQVKKALGLKSNDDLLNLSETDIQDLVNKMASATLKKDYEDNKDNAQYTTVTLDDVLKNLGASINAEDFRAIWKNMNNAQVDRAAFAAYSDSKIGSVNTYNSPVTITNTFNISGTTDPQETARVVNSELNNFLTQFVNRQKQ